MGSASIEIASRTTQPMNDVITELEWLVLHHYVEGVVLSVDELVDRFAQLEREPEEWGLSWNCRLRR